MKKQKLLHKADNYIGRKVCHYMLYVCALLTLQILQKNEKFELYCFKLYRFALYMIRVRHSAAACTRLEKYMILTVSLFRHLTVIVYKV